VGEQEFLKRAVRNMDRDVEYNFPKSSTNKEATISSGDNTTISGHSSDNENEGRFK
jgi:hypothetical protein